LNEGEEGMAWLNVIKKSQPLIVIAALEMVLPFFRMMIMSRALDLRDLGFASALAAAYSMFEVTTDIAIFRYVYALPREEYVDALDSAHALSVLRGVIVALLAFAISPLVAAAFSLRAEWSDFAILALIILIRSFEHLEPRVDERDYHFRPQLICVIVSNVLCLAALIGALAIWHNHLALTASLFGHAIGAVVTSHLVARTPFRLRFFSPHFYKAFRFGYPLMFNGIGLALSGQGDRFLVGSLLGLPALGVYSVVMLAAIVPTSMVCRLMNAMTSAALFNTGDVAENWTKRVRLFARLSPLIASGYAVGVLALANIVVPIVFGPKFQVSTLGLSLLAFSAFFRIARGEPFGSLLLMSQRTKRMAISNLSSIVALFLSALLMYFLQYVESALAGRALGEMLSFGVTVYVSRKLILGAEKDVQTSILWGSLLVASASFTIFVSPVGAEFLPTLIALGGYAVVFGCWTVLAVRPFFNVLRPVPAESATPDSEGASPAERKTEAPFSQADLDNSLLETDRTGSAQTW
jgi:O-antigen/teichoic acid export membrane protein